MPGTASGQSMQRLPRLLGQISFKCLLRWALKKILVQSDTRIRIRSLARDRRVAPSHSVHLVRLYGSFRTTAGSSAITQTSSHRRQASSTKLRYSGSFRTNLFKHQATSVKPQAASVKRQATSGKLRDPRSLEHGYWRSIRGTRTKGLYHDKCILRMTFMERNLVWTKPNFFTLGYLKFYSAKVPRSITDQ